MSVIKFLNPVRDSRNVSAYSKKVIEDIMVASGVVQITITSTARTSHDQARIMFENIERHGVDHQKKLYGRYGDKIVDHYLSLKSSGKSKTIIVSQMAAKINFLGARNVSRHAGDPSKLNVIDIAPSSIGLARRSMFEAAVNNDSRVSNFLIPPKDPAYHLEIPQP